MNTGPKVTRLSKELLNEYMADDAGLLIIGGRLVSGKGHENHVILKLSGGTSLASMAWSLSKYPEVISYVEKFVELAKGAVEHRESLDKKNQQSPSTPPECES